MTSDYDRREVAARLRVYSHDFDFDDSNPFWYVAKAAFGDVDVHTYHSVFARLADLIEPVPERTCRMIDNGAELCCSECDWRHDYDDEPKFCAGCGAEVVDE